jgi:hypothetical protein
MGHLASEIVNIISVSVDSWAELGWAQCLESLDDGPTMLAGLDLNAAGHRLTDT